MALSPDNVARRNSGSFTGTSGSAALAGGESTDQGNTLLIFVLVRGTSTPTVSATGFVVDHSMNSGADRIYLLRRSNVPAGESSWTLSVTESASVWWVAEEWSGLDPNDPVNGTVTSATGTVSQRTVSGTSLMNGTDDKVYVGFAATFIAGSPVPTVSVDAVSPGNYVANTLESHTATVGGQEATVVVAAEYEGNESGGLTSGVITFSLSTTATLITLAVGYKAAGTALYPKIEHILGAQHGTTAGWTTGNTGFRYLESASAGASITTTNPRHHTYCFLLNATAAICNFTSYAITAAGGVFLMRFSFRLNSSLPAANLELGAVVGLVTVRYVQASQKIGVQLAGGTEQLSAATVSANAWYSVDLRLDTSTTAWTCEWQTMPDSTKVGTEETTATATGVVTTSFTPRIGWSAATTGNVNVADVVTSSTKAAYPLGDYEVWVSKADASVAALCDNNALFNQFTNNGTMAAINLSTAAGLLDDLPATIGASSDGVAMITNATVANEELWIFCEPLTLGVLATTKGWRPLVVGWAASGTAATIRFRARVNWTTGSISSYAPVADYALDASTTTPAWVCGPVIGTASATQGLTNTQAADSAGGHRAILMGASNDAAPDIGMHACYWEVAVKKLPELTLQRGPDGNAMAKLRQDPNTSGYIGLTFTAPSDRGMSYSYEFPAGTTNGPTALAAGASSSTITIDATALTSVPRVNCTLDPVP